MKPAFPVSLLLVLALPSCAGDRTAPGEAGGGEQTDTRAARQAEEVTLPAGPDLADLHLGPIVQAGTGGQAAAAAASGPDGNPAGEIRSYVACPIGITRCNPGELSAGTVYTYIVEVMPGAGTVAFRTTRPLSGFTGTAGFDHSQAEAAIPKNSKLAMRCDGGALVWMVSGGGRWSGAPITVYWQSLAPPERSDDAYQLITASGTRELAGVMPAEDFDSVCG